MNKKLLYSRFFHSRDGQAWRWYLLETITNIKRVVKYSHQRARRGWADCDVWSIDSWFCSVVPHMLRKLADNKQGTPIAMFPDVYSTDDEKYHDNWVKVLHQMASDLEATDRYWDELDYDDLPEPKFISGVEYTPEERAILDQSIAEEAAAGDKVKAGVAGFYEWFYSLWD